VKNPLRDTEVLNTIRRISAAEILEGRRMFAAAPAVSRGTLEIEGDPALANTIDITVDASNVQVRIRVAGDTPTDVTTNTALPLVKRLHVVGGSANDAITVNDPSHLLRRKAGTFVGLEGDDVIVGILDGPNRMLGGAGSDTLTGGNLKDFLDGSDGNDVLNGGEGHDRILGGKGEDKLTGGDGNDLLTGGDDNDTLDGGKGRDVLRGGAGNDSLNGGSTIDAPPKDDGERDVLVGGFGSDTLEYDTRDHNVFNRKDLIPDNVISAT
jgi:Ca2+-binding RTX toxin-like protein